jgi:hypothetical protein
MMNTSRDAMSRHRARPLLLWFGIVVILQGCLLTFLPQGVTVITQMLQVASVVLLLLAIVLWRTQLRPGAELFVKTAVGVSTMSVSLLLVRFGPAGSDTFGTISAYAALRRPAAIVS